MPMLSTRFAAGLHAAAVLALVFSSEALALEPPLPSPGLPQPDPESYLHHAPVYSMDEQCAGIEGTVVLLVTVGSDGNPGRILVEKSSKDLALDRAAVLAVKGWRFIPKVVDGQPVEGIAKLPIVFTLSGERPAGCPDIRSIQLSASVDPHTGKALQSTKIFHPGDSVHVVIDLGGRGKAKVELAWRQIKPWNETYLHRDHFDSNISAPGPVEASFVPDGGFKTGQYDVEVRVNGIRVGQPDFEVR